MTADEITRIKVLTRSYQEKLESTCRELGMEMHGLSGVTPTIAMAEEIITIHLSIKMGKCQHNFALKLTFGVLNKSDLWASHIRDVIREQVRKLIDNVKTLGGPQAK